jgi:hypothetical protein
MFAARTGPLETHFLSTFVHTARPHIDCFYRRSESQSLHKPVSRRCGARSYLTNKSSDYGESGMSLWTWAANGHTVHPPDNALANMKHRFEDIDRGKNEGIGKRNLSHYHFVNNKARPGHEHGAPG